MWSGILEFTADYFMNMRRAMAQSHINQRQPSFEFVLYRLGQVDAMNPGLGVMVNLDEVDTPKSSCDLILNSALSMQQLRFNFVGCGSHFVRIQPSRSQIIQCPDDGDCDSGGGSSGTSYWRF